MDNLDLYMDQVTVTAEQMDGSVSNSTYVIDRMAIEQSYSLGDLLQLKILLVDDHQMIRSAIRDLIKEKQGMEVIGEAANGKEAIKLYRSMAPDIILMDVDMPKMNRIEATRKITLDMPDICIIGLSMHHEKRSQKK